MESYTALLRGINVGGHRKIKMADLRAYLSEMGLTDVQSYIQSGNIVFKSDERDRSVLSKQISVMILKEFGFEVPVVILQLDDLILSLESNPFKEEELDKLSYTFLSKLPEKEDRIELLKIDHSPDVFSLAGTTLWMYVPNGAAKSKLSNNLFEKKLKVHATTRNWKTVNKLISMLQD